MPVEIRTMKRDDWGRIRDIYLEGIATGHATFETDSPDWETWDTRHLNAPRLVAVRGADLVGWAALSPVSLRRVYRGVAEVSVYVAEASRGDGVGQLLLEALVRESERCEIWTLQASIFPENEGSISLHQKCGFREVGVRKQIGQLNGVWRDTVLLERRSEAVGTT
ncbi:MAG TPA: GNAT family N-acetyltransferase [Pyrinomonadaceae bacterium]|nr:GNAT family N-acetyltransferase [Pyrinomonadaceae bacterium]